MNLLTKNLISKFVQQFYRMFTTVINLSISKLSMQRNKYSSTLIQIFVVNGERNDFIRLHLRVTLFMKSRY